MPQQENTPLYNAVVGAFSLVSFADSQVHASEISRLIRTLKNESFFRNIDEQTLLKNVFDCVGRLNKDFEEEKIWALSQIANVKNDASSRDLILKIARLTLIADGKILESEENQIADIHAALGIKEK